MAQFEKYWDKIADKYERRPVPDEEAYKLKLSETRQFLRPEMEVLEIGCGTGTTAINHAPYVHHITAIDISGRMIEIAREKAKFQKIENISFQVMAAESVAVSTKQFDVVMTHSLLHLVQDRFDLIRSFHNLLKPGGYFVSSTACLKGSTPFLRVVLPLGASLGLLPKVYFLSPEQLLVEIKQGGFNVLKQWQPKPDQALFIVAQRN